jgi:uncharacterized protein YkwD
MVWKGAGGGTRHGLAALAVAVVALAASAGATPARTSTGDCTPQASWGTLQPASVETEVIALVNAHRAALGLHTLTPAPSLSASAEWKSLNMAGYNYMQHDDPAPVARTVSDRLGACGYPSTSAAWGENIAYGFPSAQSVMTAWLNDPPHRENLEDPAYTTIGVGAASNGSGVIFWTQDFGTTGGSAPAPTPAPTPAAPASQPPQAPQSQSQPDPQTTPQTQPQSPPQPQGKPSPNEAAVSGPDVQAELPQTYGAAPSEGADGNPDASVEATFEGVLSHDPLTRGDRGEASGNELAREETRHVHVRNGRLLS